jgi:UDP-N-acetylglucosamine--N-acetylmuramyl-(pentapeptide) pyrophosphoryl-undecaprenol N-acetylglucosamine transferase
VHLTGSRDAQRVRERYLELGTPAEVLPFVSDMVSLYIQSGLAICRGGASTLAELACAGIPAVVYPHPGAVRQHQLRNAEQYASEGGVVVLHETAVPEAARELSGHLKRLLEETATRERMAIQQHRQARPRAAEEIAAAILKHFPG